MLDPGLMTGWSWLSPDFGFVSGEEDFMDTGELVKKFCSQRGRKYVGWERFDITPHTWRMRGSSDAIEVIGIVRYLATLGGAQLITPMSREGKRQVPDGMLRALGWYRPGHGGHANDAARHLAAWMISQHFMSAEQQSMIAQYLQEESLRN
jgi:hypothetical protein